MVKNKFMVLKKFYIKENFVPEENLKKLWSKTFFGPEKVKLRLASKKYISVNISAALFF